MHKLGIIGFGGMAMYHLENLEKYDRVEVKGSYDILQSRQEAAEKKGLIAYSSKEELFNDPDIDIVLIATSNECHKELSIEAMKCGKNVICEKPVTLSSSELLEIMEASKKYNKVFTINQNRRTNKDFVLMRRKVEEGLLGEVYHYESRVEGSRGMPAGWRTLKALGGGMMLDWGVHLIDQMLYMLPNRVTSVYCKMLSIQYPEVDDNFRLNLTFDNGTTALIEVATNNYVTHPRWMVYGKDGSMQIDDWSCEGKIIRCIDKEDKWAEEIVYTKAGPTKTMAPRNEHSIETIKLSEPMDFTDTICHVYDQFCDAIEGKCELTIKPEQALRVLKVMESAFESAKTGDCIKTNI